MRWVRLFNGIFWLYLWLSDVLGPVTNTGDFWSEKTKQLFRLNSTIGHPLVFLGTGIIPLILWLVIDRRFRRRGRPNLIDRARRRPFDEVQDLKGNINEVETSPAKLGSGDPAKSGLVAEPQFRPVISELPGKRSYFIRHWRGQLSLPVSYWINSVLGTVAVVFVLALVGALVQPTESLLTWAFLIFTAWIFAVVVTVWQLVGVWRSAGNHKSRGGSGFWAGAARFMICLGFLSSAGALFNNAIPELADVLRIVAGDKETGDHTLKILRDGTELEFSGGITFGITDEVHKLLDTAPSIKVIHLNSWSPRRGSYEI